MAVLVSGVEGRFDKVRTRSETGTVGGEWSDSLMSWVGLHHQQTWKPVLNSCLVLIKQNLEIIILLPRGRISREFNDFRSETVYETGAPDRTGRPVLFCPGSWVPFL